jgi:hypothetical protein
MMRALARWPSFFRQIPARPHAGGETAADERGR